MTSDTRVPRAEITGLYGAVMKRIGAKMFGELPEPLEVMWHNKQVLRFSLGMGQKSQRWHECDESLKAYAHMAVASLVGCSWCLDLGYFQAHNEGLDLAKAREVPRWRESDVFTPLERDVMEYAEAMSQTPPTVTDELSARLLEQLGAPGAGGADRVGRAGEPVHPRQHRPRHRGAGVRGRLRAGAAGAAERRSVPGMTDDPFVAHRSLLFTVAYEMLGSAADAEDVVQETWLRWADVDDAARAAVRDPRAYLVRIATRQALNRLRTLARRREDYVGQWLPEPLLTSPDVAEDVELAESVSIAMLTVLETLGPDERAVFVLREVFDDAYDEIAEAVGKTPAAVRQIAHRARAHVAARRPRQQVSRHRAAAGRGAVPGRGAQRRRAGADGGARAGRRRISDGGGVVAAALHPIRARTGWRTSSPCWPARSPDFEARSVWLNGARRCGSTSAALDTVAGLVVEDGRITRIHAIRNPQKLARLDQEATLTR